MSTLNNFPTEATDIQDADLMPIKRGTGTNSDKKITGANVKAMFATPAQGALADSALQLEDTDLVKAMFDVEVPEASQAEMEAGTETNVRQMTPERVAQAIAALSGGTGTVGVYIAAAHNAAAGQAIYVNRASAYTITFPASPGNGDFVVLINYSGSPSNDITLDFQGKNLNGASSAGAELDPIIEIQWLSFDSANNTWRSKSITQQPEFPASGGLTPVFITNADSPYAATAGEMIFCDTSGGAIMINLPAGADKDNIKVLGDATSGTNNITTVPDGAELVDPEGDTSFVIDQDFATADLAYEAAGTVWRNSITGTPEVLNIDDTILALTTGIQTDFIYPDLCSGTAGVTLIKTAGANASIPAAVFPDSGVAYGQLHFMWAPRKKWDEGQFRFRFYWGPTNTNTGNIEMGLYGQSVAQGDITTVSGTQGVTVIDTPNGTIDDLHVSDWSAWTNFSALVGTPAFDELMMWRLQRNAPNANDTFTGSVEVYLIELQWVSDAATDD